MKVIIYLNIDAHCPACVRVMPYLRHISRTGSIAIRDAGSLDRIRNKVVKAQLKGDFAYQDEATPLVYLNGEYIGPKELMGRVKAWELARNECTERSGFDFILGEAYVG